MNSRSRNLIVIAAVAGLTSGFTVRWIQRGGAFKDGAGTAGSSGLSSALSQKDSASPLGKKANPLTLALEQQLSVSTGVTRWLEWMAALEHANIADFPYMVRMAKSNPVALKMIAARWIELDPLNLFDTLVATVNEPDGGESFPRWELGQQLIEDWTRRDAAAAVAALSRTGFPAGLRDLRYTALNSIMKKDPELGLKTMFEWHVDNYGADTTGIGKWAAANPQHAAEFALSHPCEYTTQSALGEIGKVWAKADPEAALSFASGLKDKYGVSLASGIVRAWAEADIGKAAAWLASADDSVRGRLSGPMVELWAKSDTPAAMDWIQEHMSGSSMDEAIGSVLKGAAEKDVASAAELVTGMDASASRAKAAASVAKKWFPRFDSTGAAAPEAIAWLSSLDPVSIKHVVEQVQWQWAGADPKSLCDFLVSPAGQSSPDYAFYGTAREMARRNPMEALEWAKRLPEEHQTAVLSNIFGEWQASQPAAAMEWLRKLPSTDPRRESYYLASIQDFFPGGAEANRVAKALAAGNTSVAREAISNLSVSDEIKQRITGRLQLK